MSAEQSKSNFFERTIAKLSPTWGLKRSAAREALAIFEKKRAYDAGRPNRSNAGWDVRRNSSANTETLSDLAWLRERSRDLVRNNPYAKKAVQVITTNVVGAGIRPSLPKDALPKTKEIRIMSAWKKWAETTECDFNGQFNFYGLEAQIMRAVVESGDAIVKIVRDPSSKTIPVKLQLLEADYLDESRDGTVTGDGNYIIGGVEFYGKGPKRGQRAGYWLFTNHPSDMMPMGGNLMSKFVPADQILHIYEVLRPGQVRGIPRGVAAFMRLKNLDDYEEAQLVRQKIAACFSVFIKKNDASFLEKYDEQLDGEDKLPPMSEKVSPGIIDYLQPGEDVTFASPPGADGFEPYTRANLRAIAAGFLITYESMSNDLSGVNFSSYRAGWLEMHGGFSHDQEHTIKGMFCQPVWNDVFLLGCYLKGIYTGDKLTADWTPPRRPMIDPVKEAQGYRLLIRAGLATRSDIARELGWDPEDLFTELVAEQVEADKAGLMLDSDAKHDANRVNFGKEAFLLSKQRSSDKKVKEKTTE